MTIKEQLLQDELQNKTTAIAIAKQAAASEKMFDELMTCFISLEYRLAQRAAWSVSHAVNINQKLVFPYLKVLVDQLLPSDVHHAVVRNSVRILKFINIPEEHHGEVMNACFLLAEEVETPIAIKAFALSTLYSLSVVYPDIQNELETVAEANLISESAAVKSVSQKVLKDLHKSKTPRINNQTAKINKHRSEHDAATGKQANSTNQPQ